MSKKQILDYRLELEDVKENELPEKDKDKIINFNDNLSNNYGLFGIDVLENDNLYFKGRIISNTKSENNAKLKLLIAEINEFYKKYGLKKVVKSMIAYGHTMLSEDEREAIERLKAQLNFWKKQNIKNSDCEIILNLITKLQKENEERDKQIDLITSFIYKALCKYPGTISHALRGSGFNDEECANCEPADKKICKDCIKQYFERKVRDERN